MSRFKIIFCTGIFACMLVLGCSSAEQKASELYELAAFEQQQFNPANALKLYDRILTEYPDTKTAQQAKAAQEKLLSEAKK